MKDFVLAMLFGTLVTFNIHAQLAIGDIAFIGYNTDAPDGFTFITLAPIPGSAQIYFTDQGIVNSTTWQSNSESHWLFTAPLGGIPCGTIIEIKEPTAGASLTVNGAPGATIVYQPTPGSNSNFSLFGGDQIIAYQADSARTSFSSTTFMAGIHGDDGGANNACTDQNTKWSMSSCVTSTSQSIIPPGLTNGVNAVSLFPTGSESDNAKFTGGLGGSSSNVRAAIHNVANWSRNNSTPFDISPSSFGQVSITCSAACTNPVSITMTPYNGAHFLPQLDPYTFYFGTTQWKRITMNHSGGVGPFTYTWGKVGTGQLKQQSASGKSIYLFEPFGPTKVYVTVDDAGTGCSTTDTLSIAWDDQYFCGTITPRAYKLVVCEGGITKCVSWKTAKSLILGGSATLGPCNLPNKTAPQLTAKIYPNPTSSSATLEYYGEKPSKGILMVMDMNGRVLQRAEMQVSTGVQYQSIDLSGLPNGIYFVRLNTDHAVFTEKLQLIK